MNSISAVERYQQHQLQSERFSEAQKSEVSELSVASGLTPVSDEFINSGLMENYQSVAQYFRPEAITFPDLLAMRQALYDQNLITLSEANTLVVATQTFPDNQSINLTQALDDYGQQDSSYSSSVNIEHLKVVTANIMAAHEL